MDLGDIFKQDQNNEAIRSLTNWYSMYYKTLVDSNIPQDLAALLTEDYHWLMSCSIIFGKDATHYPPRS